MVELGKHIRKLPGTLVFDILPEYCNVFGDPEVKLKDIVLNVHAHHKRSSSSA